MIESALRALVLADSAVSALIGTRLYPQKLPQDPTYPAATYQRIDGPRLYDHGGATGLAEGRFQFDVWATTYSSAKAVAAAVRAALSGYSGTTGGVEIAFIRCLSESDRYEPQEGDTGDRGVSMDFWAQYTE